MKPKLVIYNNEKGTLWFAEKAEPFDLPEDKYWTFQGKLVTTGWKITFSNGNIEYFNLKYPLTIKNFEECPRFKHLIEEFELINDKFEIIRTKESNSLIQLPIECKGLSKSFTNVEFVLDTRTNAAIFGALIS